MQRFLEELDSFQPYETKTASTSGKNAKTYYVDEGPPMLVEIAEAVRSYSRHRPRRSHSRHGDESFRPRGKKYLDHDDRPAVVEIAGRGRYRRKYGVVIS
jgi:hypothetical protein